MVTKASYTEKDIQSFQGLEGIRKKIAMYLGQPDSHGLWTAIRELMDNWADENSAGRNPSGHLIIAPDGGVWAVDQGEGIPTGTISIKAHGTTIKMSALQAVVSELHTGGKFATEGGAYSDGSRGTHGIGVKATNATSKVFEVWTRRDGKIYHLRYENAKLVSETQVVKTGPKLPHGIVVPKWGTIFHVVQDLSLFEKGSKLQAVYALQWAKITSYMNAKFKISITGPSGNTSEFYNENGVADYLTEQVADLKATELGTHFLYKSKEMDVALSFTDCEGVQLQGYTNGLHNPAGGTHVQSALKALGSVVTEYKTSKHDFRPSDLFEGVVGLINFKIAAPAFNNQVKEKLIDERVAEPTYEQLHAELTAWFKKNKELARTLCDRATELRSLNNEFANNKKLKMELKGGRGGRGALPTKLSMARCEPKQRELFLMEGDSAGGTAQRARNSAYQEILPLRGKVLNAFKVPSVDALWGNAEILNILKSIGYNPEAKDKVADLRIGKLILLGDADKDGYHINLLNLGLLCRIVPEIFDAGMVYIAKGFEYFIEHDSGNYYGNSVTEIKAVSPATLHRSITHLKGWGECSAKGLKHMAFDPETRILQHLKMGPDCLSRVKGLLGHDTDVRKTLVDIA